MSRSLGAERLDDLDVSGPEHTRVLEDLVWLNRWLGTLRRGAKAVSEVAPPGSTIVDLGCASGDLLIELRRIRPDTTLIGVDGNAAALKMAQGRLEAEFIRADILAEDFELPPCDVVVSSHFLYHFEDRSFVRFTEDHPEVAFVLVELKRSAVSGFFFRWFVGPWISAWTLEDGVQALARAFTPAELRTLLPDWNLSVGVLEMVAVRSKQ